MSTENMTIADAIDRMGITIDHDNEDLVIARFRPAMAGMEWQKPLSDVANEQVGTNLFFSTGTFYKGSVSRSIGRTGENVRRVLEIPLDFDLKDYLEYPSDTIYEMDAAAVRSLADALWINTEPLLTKFGLIPHRVHYTGNGIHAFLRFSDDGADVNDVRRVVKDLVATLNGYAVSSSGKRVSGGELENAPKADTAATDAGTRIMRFPFGISEKASSNGVLAVRYPELIAMNTDAPVYTIAAIEKITGGPVPERSTPQKPRTANVAIGNDAFRNTVDVMSKNWRQGDRHRLSLAISAIFAKAGVPREQAEHLIQVMAGDDEELESDRMVSVATTYARYEAGESIEGFYGIRSIIPESDLAIIDKEMTAIWKASRVSGIGPTTDFKKKPEKKRTSKEILHQGVERGKIKYPEPPIEARYGWYGRFLNVAERSTESSYAMLLASMLTYTGAVVGRRIGTPDPSGRTMHGNMYLMLVGKTGLGRKSTAINFVMETVPNARAILRRQQEPAGSPPSLLDVRTPDVVIKEGLGSGQATVNLFDEGEKPVILRMDEATDMFNIMARDGDPLIQKLNRLWDSPGRMDHIVRKNAASADNPFLSLMTATQPDEAGRTIKPRHIQTGLINRMMIVYSQRLWMNPGDATPDYAALADLWEEFVGNVMSYADGAIIPLSKAAIDTLSEYNMDIEAAIELSDERDDGSSGREPELIVRYPIHARKFALMFAISDGAPQIEKRHVDAGIALAEWMRDGVRRHEGDWGNDVSEKVERRIRDILGKTPVLKTRVMRNRMKNARAYTTAESSKTIEEMKRHDALRESPDFYVCLSEDADAIISAFGSLHAAAQHDPDDVLRAIQKGASS